MIVLDTNVISELLRPAPQREVEAWLGHRDAAALYFTTVGEAELRYGVALLPAGKKRSGLTRAINGIMEEDFRGRILPFDRQAASAYSSIAAERRAAGRPISQFDCQIAAIVRSRGACLATRNIRDFDGCEIEVINPWDHISEG